MSWPSKDPRDYQTRGRWEGLLELPMLRRKEELSPKVRRRLWPLRVIAAALSFAVIMALVSATGGDTGHPRWFALAVVVGFTVQWIAEVLVRHRFRKNRPGDRTETLL